MADMLNDDIFTQYVKQQEAEAKLSSNRSSFNSREYEDIHWTALEANVPTVIRVVGGPPDSDIKEDKGSTARTVTLARIVDDSGKMMKIVRPSFQQDPSYILNRIIAKIKQPKYEKDGTKTLPVLVNHPDLYNLIDKNGIPSTDARYKYEKGWGGREVFIMNVIDRSRMEEHRALKHTMLLARNITEKNGTEFADEGVSAFALGPKINKLFRSYGSWEKYDIAITRTGDMNNAFEVSNASKCPEEVNGPAAAFISEEKSLTDEEKSWERYDLSKLYRYTTATKIYNRLKNTIKRIDNALGTNFIDELQDLVEKEKALFEELYKEEESAPVAKTEAPVIVEESKPVSRTRSVVENAKPGSDLPYYHTLSDALKSKIISATKNADGSWDIKWDVPLNQLASCPGGGEGDVNHNCSAVAPLECTCCPACGLSFT